MRNRSRSFAWGALGERLEHFGRKSSDQGGAESAGQGRSVGEARTDRGKLQAKATEIHHKKGRA